jgi:hypothetical protein
MDKAAAIALFSRVTQSIHINRNDLLDTWICCQLMCIDPGLLNRVAVVP